MVDFCIQTTADNDELLLAAKGGCIRSINELLTRCRVHIRSHVNGYLGKRSRSVSPDDVTQEILYVVYRDLYKCRAERWTDFLQFLVTVSRNKTLHAIEKQEAKKRGGSHRTETLAIDLPMHCTDWLESNDLDELMEKLEAIANENEKHRAVLESYIECIDLPCTSRIPLAQTKMGCTRSETYSANKRFKSVCEARLSSRHSHELLAAVRDDLNSGCCRRLLRNVYGLLPSEIDAIELSR